MFTVIQMYTTLNVLSISKKMTSIHPCLSLKENLFNPILKKKCHSYIFVIVELDNSIYTIAFFFYKIKIHVHVGLQKSNWNDNTMYNT